MKIGFHLTPFWSPVDRGPTRIIDEAIQVVAAASRMGFAWVSMGQHWLSHPTVWPQPLPMLARLAPETGSMRRAARLTDGVFFGPQVAWRDVGKLSSVFREARAETGAATPGSVGASRSLIVGTSKEAAVAAAREYLEKTFAMYRAWDMQERTMASLQLSFDAALDDWTVHGSPHDCVEVLQRAREMGLDRIGLSIYSLPRDVAARIDYLRMIAEEILRPVGEAVEPRRLALEARGRDPAIGAEIAMRVTLDIEARGEESLLRIDAEGRILGKLGALGHGVIQRKAEEAVEEFGARLKTVARG